MAKKRKATFRRGATYLLGCFLVMSSCAVEPEDPGMCKLSCSKAVIGASDYVASPLGVNSLRVHCESGGPGVYFNNSIRFKIEKTIVSEDGKTTKKIPVPNISIVPNVYGLVNETVGKGSYLGITTDTSQFCSDQCGVVTLGFSAQCPAAESTEVSISISSGSLTSDPFTVNLEAPTEDDDK